MYNRLSFRSACVVNKERGLEGGGGESYHKMEGWDEEIGVKCRGEGNKFFITGSSGYYLNYLPLLMHPRL